MSDSEELNVGDFDPYNLSTCVARREHTITMIMIASTKGSITELGFTDAQVEAEVEKAEPRGQEIL